MRTAYGAISIPSQRLRSMLAQCTYWQQFAGRNWSDTEALERIYLDTFPQLDDILSNPANRPLAVIYRDGAVTWESTSRGIYTPTGKLVIEFHRDPPDVVTDDPGDQELAYSNDIGRIIGSGEDGVTGLTSLSASGTNIDLLSISAEGPMRVPLEQVAASGDAWLYWLDITWGTRR